MSFTIAVIAPGAMGAAIGARLSRYGATVLTSFEGRGQASQERAAAAGMKSATDEKIVTEAKVILSVVPPAKAINLAKRLSAPLKNSRTPGLYVDCNAISVSVVSTINEMVSDAGAHFIDGAIIGLPPEGDEPGPMIYLSGDLAGDIAAHISQLERYGLRIHRLDGAVGAASALKLSYAGITKGMTALGAAIILAAERAGTGAALKQELAASQPQILARLSKALPDMYPKAYRWVDEMRFIAEFIGPNFQEADILKAAADFYARLAADVAGHGEEQAALDKFLSR